MDLLHKFNSNFTIFISIFVLHLNFSSSNEKLPILLSSFFPLDEMNEAL